MLHTLPTLLLQIGVVLALVAGTTAFVSLDKSVTVSVDGQDQQVRSFARTVGDLLDIEGIGYDVAHDLVTPASSLPGARVTYIDASHSDASRDPMVTGIIKAALTGP